MPEIQTFNTGMYESWATSSMNRSNTMSSISSKISHQTICPMEVWIEGRWYSASVALDGDCLSLTLNDVEDDVSGGSDDVVGSEEEAVRVVTIQKTADEGLGVSVKGGSENDMPVIISKIFPGMAAAGSGQLRVGDAILAVNGEDLREATHERAVALLKGCGATAALEVQYLPEVTQYLRKAALLAQMSWSPARPYLGAEVAPPVPPPPSADTRLFPLLLSRLTRQLRAQDPLSLELHSPDLRHCCLLRCPDATQAAAWCSTLHSTLSALTQQAIETTNKTAQEALDNSCVLQMGWMGVRQLEQGQGAETRPWEPCFTAITDRELLVYSRAPWTSEEWARPRTALPIAMTRLVRYRLLARGAAAAAAAISFSTRTGTQRGVVAIEWRVETPRQLACWSRTVVQAAHTAVAQVDEIIFECRWRNRAVLLSMQHENGLTLRVPASGGRGPVLWHHSFDKLTTTRDDDRATVWLVFGRETVELDMGSSPKPFVFALHTCLSSKVEQLGPS